jgi:hypothetical protein
MPVSQDVADRIKEQLGDWEPKSVPLADAEPAPAAVGGHSLADVGGDLSARVKKGVRGGDELIKAGIHAAVGPLIPETGKAGEIAGRIMRPVFEDDAKAINERAKNPQTFVGKVLGGAAEGAGGMLTMPMGGGLARNIIAAVGMGEGADIAGSMMGGLFSYFGGEKYRATGEGTGTVLGGGVGAQANVGRVRAMGEVVGQVGSGVKSIPAALQSARARQAAGDERSLWPIFADEFGALRAKTNGLIQEFTNRQVAGLIRQDYRASDNAKAFVEDAKVTGLETKDWGLGERTLVPSLTETTARARPDSAKEAATMAERVTGMKLSIKGAYDRLVQGAKLPADEKGIEASAKAFQAFTQKKVDALTAETGQVKEAFPRLNVREEHEVGDKARALRDKMAGESYQIASGKYLQAEQMADTEGVQIKVGAVREQATEILQNFYSKVDPSKVPPVVKDLLKATEVKQGGEASLLLPDELAAERAGAKAEADSAGKPLTLKEANDLSRALGEAASNAKSSENYVSFNRAKELEAQVQETINSTKMSPETLAAYGEARRYWAKEHAPRFQEGLGKAMGKERGGVYEGREALKSEKIMDEVLSSETAMRDFDTTFGKDPQAKQLLNVALQDRFRKTVLDRPFSERMFEANLNEFKTKYANGLDRLPEVADKIDAQAAKMLTLQNEKKMELQRYRDIMGSDVTKAVGPIQAKAMFQAALSDPLKMEQLLAATKGGAAKELVKEVFQQANPFKNGDYDPEAILKIVQAGKRTSETPSPMETLFSRAFGEREGKRHLDTLEAISRFTIRQAATDPKYLQAGSILTDSPVKSATGAGMQSWVNDLRAVSTGRTGANYTALLGMSRFVNAKVQNAVEQAKRRALYDPETATAILELSATPSSQPLSLTTARKVFGDIRTNSGQSLVDRLIDKGYVKAYVFRGMIYGAEKAIQESEDPESRQNRRRASEGRP